jgi:hypothetical protein
MVAELMIKPSSLIPSGIEVEPFGSAYLFRFNDHLQTRMEDLLEKGKTDQLNPKELSRIFTLINAQLAAKCRLAPTD